jgi:hypothetical protein
LSRLGDLMLGDARASRKRETRDPKAATKSTSYYSTPGRPQMAQWDATAAFEAYTGQWLVGRALTLIADRISSWPIRVGADPDKPGDFDKTAPLAQLLGPMPGQPFPEMTARQLVKWIIVNRLVTGRAGLEIEYGSRSHLPVDSAPGRALAADSSNIVGLWPLVTAALFPVDSLGPDEPNPAMRRRYFSRYEYRPFGSADYVELGLDQVCYGWNPSPLDPRQPYSILQSAALNINLIYEIDTYSYAFIRNDATPASLIVHPPFETPEMRTRWRDRILGNHQGAANAGKTAFAEADLDENGKVAGAYEVIKLGASARDSQLKDIYEQQLSAVSGATGVPMSRLDASGRTYNNAEQEDVNWHEDSLLTLSGEIADVFNRQVAPKFDRDLVAWFDLSKVRALKPRITTGVAFQAIEGDMLRDERRAFADLGPVDLDALVKEKEADAKMATPPLLAPPGDYLGRIPTSGVAPPSIGHQKPAATGSADAANADTSTVGKPGSSKATSSTGNGAARAVAVERFGRLLADQLADLDARALTSTQARAAGKRGQQMLRDGEVRADALFERDFWTTATLRAIAPVYVAAAAAAELAVVEDQRRAIDLDAWANREAAATAESRVDAILDNLGDALDEFGRRELPDLETAIRSGYTCDDWQPRIAVGRIFDDAVRALTATYVPVETLRGLLERVEAGDVDLDAARVELETTT